MGFNVSGTNSSNIFIILLHSYINLRLHCVTNFCYKEKVAVTDQNCKEETRWKFLSLFHFPNAPHLVHYCPLPPSDHYKGPGSDLLELLWGSFNEGNFNNISKCQELWEGRWVGKGEVGESQKIKGQLGNSAASHLNDLTLCAQQLSGTFSLVSILHLSVGNLLYELLHDAQNWGLVKRKFDCNWFSLSYMLGNYCTSV